MFDRSPVNAQEHQIVYSNEEAFAETFTTSEGVRVFREYKLSQKHGFEMRMSCRIAATERQEDFAELSANLNDGVLNIHTSLPGHIVDVMHQPEYRSNMALFVPLSPEFVAAVTQNGPYSDSSRITSVETIDNSTASFGSTPARTTEFSAFTSSANSKKIKILETGGEIKEIS